MHSGGSHKLCTLSPPDNSPHSHPPPFFFLPLLPNFHSSLSFSVFSYPVRAPFTSSLLKSGKKAQQQQLATLFSRAGIEGLGALCMSEPHSSSSIQRCILPPLFTKALLCQEQGSRGKEKEGSALSVFVLHIAIQAFPKPPLMSWPQCCERRVKQVCEREKV